MVPQIPTLAETVKNLGDKAQKRMRVAKMPNFGDSFPDSPTGHMDLELQNLLLRSKLDNIRMNMPQIQNIMPQNLHNPFAFSGFHQPQPLPFIQQLPMMEMNPNLRFDTPLNSIVNGFIPNLSNPVQIPLDLVGDVHDNFMEDGQDHQGSQQDLNEAVHDTGLDILQSNLNEHSLGSGQFSVSAPMTHESSFDFNNNGLQDNSHVFGLRSSEEGDTELDRVQVPSEENQSLLQWFLQNVQPESSKSAEDSAAPEETIIPAFQPLPPSTSHALQNDSDKFSWLEHFSEEMKDPHPKFAVASPVWQRSIQDDDESTGYESNPHFSPLLANQGISEGHEVPVPEFVAMPQQVQQFFRYSLPPEALNVQNQEPESMRRSLDNVPQGHEPQNENRMDPNQFQHFDQQVPEGINQEQTARAPTFNHFLNTDITIHKTWATEPWNWGIFKPKPHANTFSWGAPQFPSSTSSSASSSEANVPHASAADSSSAASSAFQHPEIPPPKPLSAFTVNTQENHVFNNVAPHSQQNIQIANADGNSGLISQSQTSANEFVGRPMAGSEDNEILGSSKGSPSHLFAMPMEFLRTFETQGDDQKRRRKRDINWNTAQKPSGAFPLANLFIDPNVKLNVPETLKNLGAVARNSFEDPNGPLYHVRNTLSSARDVVLSVLKIPHHELIIPTKYKIVEHVPEDLVGDINTSLLDSEQGRSGADVASLPERPSAFEGIPPYLNTYLKLGSMLRESIQTAQDSLEHVGEVVNSAKKTVHSTLMSAPRVLKYTHVPVLKHQKPLLDGPMIDNKVMLIGPKLLRTSDDYNADPANIHDDFVGVGRLMQALGISDPDTEKLGYHKLVYKEKIPFSQHGHAGKPKIEMQPRPSIVLIPDPDHYKNKAAMKEDMVGSALQSLQKAKDTVGATSLEDFFSKMKMQWSELVGEDLTNSIKENVEKLGVINEKLEEKLDKFGNPQMGGFNKYVKQPKYSLDSLGYSNDLFKAKENLTPAEKLKLVAEENMEKFNALQKSFKEKLGSLKRSRSVRKKDYFPRDSEIKDEPIEDEVVANEIIKGPEDKTEKQTLPIRFNIPIKENFPEIKEDNSIENANLALSFVFPKSIVKRQDRFDESNEIVGTGLGLPQSLMKPYMGLVSEEQIHEMDEFGSAEDEMRKNSIASDFVRAQNPENSHDASNKNQHETAQPHLTSQQLKALEYYLKKGLELYKKGEEEQRVKDAAVKKHEGSKIDGNARQADSEMQSFETNPHSSHFSGNRPLIGNNWNQDQFGPNPTINHEMHFNTENFHENVNQNADPKFPQPQNANRHPVPSFNNAEIPLIPHHDSRQNPANLPQHQEAQFPEDSMQSDGQMHPFEMNENQAHPFQIPENQPMNENNWHQEQIQPLRPSIEEHLPEAHHESFQNAQTKPHEQINPQTNPEHQQKHPENQHHHVNSGFHLPAFHLPHQEPSSPSLHPSSSGNHNQPDHHNAVEDALDPFHLLPPLHFPAPFAPQHPHHSQDTSDASGSSEEHQRQHHSLLDVPLLPQIPALPPLPGLGSRDTDDGSPEGFQIPSNPFPLLPSLEDMLPLIPNPPPNPLEHLFRDIMSGNLAPLNRAPLLPLPLRPFRMHHARHHERKEESGDGRSQGQMEHDVGKHLPEGEPNFVHNLNQEKRPRGFGDVPNQNSADFDNRLGIRRH